MKILILGGSGMLGHQLWRHFRARHETWVTLRRDAAEFRPWGLFDDGRVFAGVDAMDLPGLARVIRDLKPDVVLNCIGIIKQQKGAKNPISSLSINALLPHRLAEYCGESGARLVLFSTDCVFSGRRGAYKEDDVSDAEDLYGRTKYLGEVADLAHVVTLRSSIIGRELGTAHSLIDWFLSQRGRGVRGYQRAIYTGFTTMEMARIVEQILIAQPALSGLWQVASAPISKYELLLLVREKFGLDVEIEPWDQFACDRSLIGTRFNAAANYSPPPWPAMVAELAVQSN